MRFVAGGDLHQIRVTRNPEAIQVLSLIAQEDPDFMLLYGDMVDVDGYGPFRVAKVDPYLRMYEDNWSQPALASLLLRTASFGMLDDHEILNDWDRGNADPYQYARAAWETYVGRRNPQPVRPGVLYYTFEAGGVGFFVLDDRSYRDPHRDPDDAQKSMLGQQQKDDLLAWLQTSTATFKFVVSTVQWNDHQVVPIRQFDGWDGYRTERSEIFDFIAERKIAGVTLLSADAHWSGVFRASPTMFEFACTPLGVTAVPAPRDTAGAPDVVYYYGDRRFNNFCVFETDTTVSPAQMHVRIINSGGETTYETTLTKDQLTP
jgi:alkaline phosphatase D